MQGSTDLVLTLGPRVRNPLGNVHGGVLLGVSELAGRLAVPVGRPGQHPLTTTSISVAYLRPGRPPGELRLVSEVVHPGRSVAQVRVSSVRADGKVCSVATVGLQRAS